MTEKIITVGNMKLTIEQEDSPRSPREDDNFGTIAYKHRDYKLGEEVINDICDWLAEKLGLADMEYKQNNATRLEYEKKFMDPNISGFVALPVFLYDHSGITISTGSFNDRFDSGQLGYIYVSKEKVIEEYGDFSQESQDKAIALMESEIKTFDQYVIGDVYSFKEEEIIKCEHCGHIEFEQKDSCGGFYGTDWKTNGITDHVSECFVAELEKES
jgi:hypothetical protein